MRRGAWFGSGAIALLLVGCLPPAASLRVTMAPAVEAPLLAPPVEMPADVAEIDTIAPAEEWPFLDQAIGSCVRDALTRTPYLVDWYAQARVRHDGPPDGPRPILSVHMPIHGPVPLSADYDRERTSMLAAWDAPERRSHIMDCTAPVAVKRNGRAGGTSRVPYTIYLPADYLDHPQRRRAVLLLASGGAGSRTRWFLPPLRTDGKKRATGGLAMQVRIDEWAAAHPEVAPPLVVSVDGSSEAFVNGMAAFIDHELPDHLLSAYLPHQTREQTPYGVEAVSSGAIVTLGALRANPHLFRAVGLTSLYCGRGAFSPRKGFGHAPERKALLAELAARRESGLFDLRFSIGSLDEYWACNYELFRDLQVAGVLTVDSGPPEDRCAPSPTSPSGRHCAGLWSAFESWAGTAHHYRALLAALPSALEWNLERLERALARDESTTSD